MKIFLTNFGKEINFRKRENANLIVLNLCNIITKSHFLDPKDYIFNQINILSQYTIIIYPLQNSTMYMQFCCKILLRIQELSSKIMWILERFVPCSSNGKRIRNIPIYENDLLKKMGSILIS